MKVHYPIVDNIEFHNLYLCAMSESFEFKPIREVMIPALKGVSNTYSVLSSTSKDLGSLDKMMRVVFSNIKHNFVSLYTLHASGDMGVMLQEKILEIIREFEVSIKIIDLRKECLNAF